VLLKPYIIGIGLDDQKMTFFDCVGKYYNPKNEKELGTIFTSVISQALDNTSLQVELLDSKKMPTQTNVEMTLINAKNNKAEYNYFHTMNWQNKPDTFFIDPSYTYNLQLNTTPPVYKNNISLKVGTHNVVKVDAPQGNLSISCASAREYVGLPCLVRRAGKSDIIYVQDMYNTHKYLTGSYDLEILTLPRIKFSNVKVTEGATANKIVIPAPGKLELTYSQAVIASIYILRNNTQEWVADIDGATVQRKELYLLQPGRYIVVYRRANAIETESTREANFSIISGSIYNLKLE
jgi:Ca-activated chloride channel family protein